MKRRLLRQFALVRKILEDFQEMESPEPREDQGVREVLPHIGPIPIIIPLKLFLEGIDFPRIMLPRALRGSW